MRRTAAFSPPSLHCQKLAALDRFGFLEVAQERLGLTLVVLNFSWCQKQRLDEGPATNLGDQEIPTR